MSKLNDIDERVEKYTNIYSNAMFDLEDTLVQSIIEILQRCIGRAEIDIDPVYKIKFVDGNDEFVEDTPVRLGFIGNSLYVISHRGLKMYVEDLDTNEIDTLYNYVRGLCNDEDEEE